MRDHLGNFMVSGNLQFARGILLLDDCEGTCNWVKAATDANATVTFETVAAFVGTKGLRLFSGDATPAEDDIVTGQRLISYPESGLLVARCLMCAPDWSKLKSVSLKASHDPGAGDQYFGQVKIVAGDGAYYYDVAGDPVELTDIVIPSVNGQWFVMELGLNCVDHEYRHVAVNGVRVDLAGVGLYNAGASTGRASDVVAVATTVGAAAATLYVDCVYAGEFVDV